jgi:4-amino-4-deoxy-L-arabinose transferase-like glycosyltransferase
VLQLQVSTRVTARRTPVHLPIRDPRQPPDLSWPYLAALLGLCVVLFFPGINTGDLWRTENLRAMIADEFLRSGDWLVPKLYGEPYVTKPPGMYTAMALLSLPMGQVTTWSARLPSVFAATITVLLFYGIFARTLGRRAGFLAALLLPMSPMWLDKATAAEMDMMQVAWVTGALYCFLRAFDTKEKARQGAGASLWWLGAMLCVAGGVLTKWTAPAFFYLTVVPFLYGSGKLRLLLGRPHVLSAVIAASLVALWFVAAMMDVGWRPIAYTVGREGAARFWPGICDEPWRWWPIFLHPLRLLAITLPWSVVALFTLRRGFLQLWDARGRMLLQFLHCWTWPNIFFFSWLDEHAPRHSFPLFAGIAGLAAFVWVAWLTGKLAWPFPRIRPRAVLTTALLCWCVVKFVHAYAVIPARNESRQPRAQGASLAQLVPAEQTLYVVGLRDRDEGILFHYRRPVRRTAVESDGNVPVTANYCLLQEQEWCDWNERGLACLIATLPGESNRPLFVVRRQEGFTIPAAARQASHASRSLRR